MSRAELHYYPNEEIDNEVNECRLFFEDSRYKETKAIAVVDKDSTAVADVYCLYRYEEKKTPYTYLKEKDPVTKMPKKKNKPDLDKKLIIGVELTAYDDIADSNISGQVTLLIKNSNGHIKLNKYMNSVITASDSDKPVYKLSELTNLTDDILVGSSAQDGIIRTAYYHNRNNIISILKKLDYIEVSPYDEKEYVTFIVNETDKNTLKVIATGLPYLKSSNGYEGNVYMGEETLLQMFSYLGDEKATEIVCDNTISLADCCEESCVKPIQDCEYPEANDAEVKLKNICMSRLNEIYANNIPGEVIIRLNSELRVISYNKCEFIFVMLHKVFKSLNIDPAYISTKGAVGNSLVAYLCGISDVDPLKYGLDMHSFYLNKALISAGGNGEKSWEDYANLEKHIDLCVPIDVKDKIYTCISNLEEIEEVYLYKITPENIRMDNPGYKAVINNTENADSKQCISEDGIVLVPKNCEASAYATLYKNKGRLFFRYGQNHWYMPFYKQSITSRRKNTMLYELAKETGVDLSAISDDNEQVLSLLKSCDVLGIKDIADSTFGCAGIPFCDTEPVSQIIKNQNIKSFQDLVACISMSHSSYEDKDKFITLSKKKSIDWKQQITNREDVFDILIDYGVDYELATAVMDHVRTGRAWYKKEKPNYKKWHEYSLILNEYGIGKQFLDECEKIRFLHPRAQAISDARVIWKLMYFKINYPKEFYKVFFKYCNNQELVEAVNKGKDSVISYTDKIDKISKYANYNKFRDIMVAKEMLERGIM